MKHIYKSGGDWQTESGFKYSIQCVNDEKAKELLSNGWSETLAEIESTPAIKKAKAKAIKERKEAEEAEKELEELTRPKAD